MKKKIKINQGIVAAVLLTVCVSIFAACQQPGTGAAALPSNPASHDSSAEEISKLASSQKAMSYDELKEWSDEKLIQAEKDVQQGVYSEENLKQDRATFEKALNDLENGATVYLQELGEGAYSLNTVFPNDEVLAEMDESGNMVFKDK